MVSKTFLEKKAHPKAKKMTKKQKKTRCLEVFSKILKLQVTCLVGTTDATGMFKQPGAFTGKSRF